MSITFSCPAEPAEEIRDEYGLYADRYHDINMANVNAFAMLRAIGITPDYCGHIQVGQLPKIARRLMELRNKASAQSSLLVPDEAIDNFYSVGRDRDWVLRATGQMYALVMQAQKLDSEITWG